MTKFKFKLWLTLTVIGLMGVASLFLSDLPLNNIPEEVTKAIPRDTLKALILVNPSLLVIISTLIGTLLYDKIHLSVPVFEKALKKPDAQDYSSTEIIANGILFGVIAGVLIVIIAKIFEPYLPQALMEATRSANLHLATKLLYGGITEELLTRFGLMSLLVWALFKTTRTLTPAIYWAALSMAALVFAIGHLPMVFQIVAEPTTPIYAYIVLGNSIGGALFGYAYWRKGLECSFIAHGVAHLTMIATNSIFK